MSADIQQGIAETNGGVITMSHHQTIIRERIVFTHQSRVYLCRVVLPYFPFIAKHDTEHKEMFRWLRVHKYTNLQKHTFLPLCCFRIWHYKNLIQM